jgi:hypothetical protein
MTFVTPALLFGASLIAVPIVLHLIMRRKPRRLEFPALRFIQRRHDRNQRRLRLRHLLLLLLRAAAIALLAFALARPSMQLSGVLAGQEEPVAAALVFDASPRMEYRHQNETRLDAARKMGQWLLAQLPRQSEIAVLDTRLGAAAFEVDRSSARNRMERLSAVANSQPLIGVVEKALDLLKTSELPRREVYIFTDLARVSWPRDATARLQERLQGLSGVGVYVIDVGVEEPANFALGDLHLPRQVLSSRGSLVVQTELSAAGTGGQRTVALDLLATDPATGKRSPQKRSEQVVALEAGQSQEVVFRVGGLTTGTHQGLVRVLGEDGLPADNARYFTFEVKPAWRILIVAPKAAHVYPSFLVQALAPTDYRLSGQARYDCETISPEELAARKLDDYSAVCLLDPRPLEDALWQKLVNYAADGHGVAVFLGRNAQPVDSFNTELAQQLLPGALVMRVNRPDFDCHLAPADYRHPILAEFGRISGTVPWDAFPVVTYWQLGELAKGVYPVVSYSDGRPAMLERPVGKGRAVTMTTPISDDTNRQPWNYLVAEESWPYLILVNEALSYLVGSSDEQLNYYAGQTVVIRLDAQSSRQSYLVTTPEGIAFPLAADPTEHVLVVSQPDRLGNYRIQSGGAKGVDRGFSVNLRREQTRMERIGNEELAETFGSTRYRLARNQEQIERDVSLGRVGEELFPWIILLVAVILGAEHVMANRFYRE